MKKMVVGLLAAVAVICPAALARDAASYVNPFIGCADNGHTFPGACVPFGIVQASPDTGNGWWAYCSGYRFVDQKIRGFSQTHLSGTGAIDLGDILLRPFAGTDCADGFTKAAEKAEPGYYAVSLEEAGAEVEVTATPHIACYRITYRKPGPARLLVDTQYGLVDKPAHDLSNHILESAVQVENPSTVSGVNRAKNWVDRRYAFVVSFDRPSAACRELPKAAGEKAPRFVFDFDLKPGEALQVKVALSGTDVAGAERNLAAEMPGWAFDEARAAARAAWNALFARAEVIEGTDDEKTNFYTALYHLFIQPSNIADVDGRYRGADDRVRVAPGKAYYSTFSLWDVFRAAMPLDTILVPERIDGFVSSMVAHQQAHGFLPVWTLWGKENNCMIGKHAVPVIADAYLKGFRGFDAEAAFAAVRESLRRNHADDPKDRWDLLDRYGYYPFDVILGESVSRTLECAYDDWCAAAFARALGHADDAAFFAARAMNYTNLFDRTTAFMRGRDSKGAWRTPFSPLQLGHGAGQDNDYTEGNAWQYLWHVMQDPEGLIRLMGGKDSFAEKLDQLFRLPPKLGGEDFVVDVTGVIGQYAQGNEPSHHVIYFYPFVGRPWRTQELVREVFDRYYLAKPDGLCGNDDCGQMSAWYVFSAMGFYPFNPCGGEYVLGAPQLPKVRLNLPSGKTFEVEARNLSKANKYVKSVTLNGRPLAGFKLSHAQLIRGGRLVFEMTSEPDRGRTAAVYTDRVRSLPQLRGVMLPARPCTEDDFKTLAAWGATLARYQMTDAPAGTEAYDRWLAGKLDHLEQVLTWGRRYGIKIVVDLHAVPGGRNGAGEMNLFFRPELARHFIDCWKRIAARFKGRPEIFGFDLMNEPVQLNPGTESFWSLQRKAARAIRAIDPETPILFEADIWDGPEAYHYLGGPVWGITNAIYQVHMYEPMAFTHQGVTTPNLGPGHRVAYPNASNRWDAAFLRAKLQPVRDFQQIYGVKIYVGEFSAAAWAPGAERYLADCIGIFNEYGWDWTYHAFREWPGWSVEHAGEFGDRMQPAETSRKCVLIHGLK